MKALKWMRRFFAEAHAGEEQIHQERLAASHVAVEIDALDLALRIARTDAEQTAPARPVVLQLAVKRVERRRRAPLRVVRAKLAGFR